MYIASITYRVQSVYIQTYVSHPNKKIPEGFFGEVEMCSTATLTTYTEAFSLSTQKNKLRN